MAAPEGNQFWLQRSKHGKDRIFNDPRVFWDAACEYFQWVVDNPFIEEKIFQHNGKIVRGTLSRPRVMTQSGLCRHLGISDDTFRNYGKVKDYVGVVSKIRNILYEQKFSLACADMANASIISRDLGLVDRQSVDQHHSGQIGGVLNVTFVRSKDGKRAE